VETSIIIALALALDYLLGEPRRWHPLVAFGDLAGQIETQFNRGDNKLQSGVIAWCIAVLPIVLVAFLLDRWFAASGLLSLLWSALVLYIAIGWHSLMQHARAVSQPLMAGDIEAARIAVAHIVSRDSATLDEAGIAKGAIESVLENGADAIFAALFWFVLLGVPGVVLYRLVNTLDAMWGYKNERYLEFGRCAARIDDLLNFIPAQLTAFTYAMLGDPKQAFHCWRSQGRYWKSPNAGPVMAAGAGAINVSVGGNENYHGKLQERSVLGPELGPDTIPSAAKLDQACQLVNRTLVIWFVVIVILTMVVRSL
jgi:adenosylcobinamide-phosphate synthase